VAGFEPTAFWSRTKRASQTALHPEKRKSLTDWSLGLQEQILAIYVDRLQDQYLNCFSLVMLEFQGSF
jgi:hypothetical protein